MKKLNLLFTIQILAGLCAASPAHAQDIALGAPVYTYPLRAHTVTWSQPPMTLPAGVNYEVGRRSDATRHKGGACLCSPAYEVEQWQVVPQVLSFSPAGRLRSQTK